MTHILFISPFYPPEKAAAGICLSEIAKRLVRVGHQVTVLTTVPNYPTGIVPLEYRGNMLQIELIEGVRVVRAWSYVSANKRFLLRILAQLSFGCLAPLLGWKAVGYPDIIIVQSPPLFDAIAGRILARLKRCPLIFMVSDLWPESGVQMGILRNPVLVRLSELLEWSTYQHSDLVWTVTEQARDSLIQRGLSAEHVFVLTYGVDTEKFSPLPQTQARAELGWNEQFTILYAGNHGLAQGLVTVLEAAKMLSAHDEIHFVLVGDGAEKAYLIDRAHQLNLKNVLFLEPLPHEKMPLLLAASEICLIPLRKLPIFEGVLPTKMYEAMACARPMLLGVAGEARRIVEQEAGAAIYVEPENPQALAAAILNLQENPEVAERLGRQGRAYVEAHFDYDLLATSLDARLQLLLQRKVPIFVPEEFTPISVSETPIPIKILAERD